MLVTEGEVWYDKGSDVMVIFHRYNYTKGGTPMII